MINRATFVFALLVLCLMTFSVLSATDPVTNRGYFGGELSTYASGDTIMYVYFNTDAAEDVADRYVNFRISTDGGANWSEYPLPQALDMRTRPTLARQGGDILVSMDRYMYRSSNLGQNWSLEYQTPFVPESTPHIYPRNGTLSNFYLNQPYPEWQRYDFTVNGIDNPLLKPYQYYTDIDRSWNNTNLPWTGMQAVTGIVRTNGDFRIRQAGGGTNNGWPVFLDKVIVGNSVISQPSNYPLNQVFQSGLLEDTLIGGFPYHNPARDWGYVMGEGIDHIYLIEVEGSTFSGMHGYVLPPRRVHIPVYSDYPPNDDSELLFTNNYTVRDTIWNVYASGLCGYGEFYVNGELWIKGEFSGKQTWTASGDIKIIGDITLTNTTPGDNPSDNNTDFVNLLSEKNVIIKYGYKDPQTNQRIHPFCGPDAEPHYIYANIYAIGLEDREGVFTFEYQHPHPSTPAIEMMVDGETQLFENIDIHRRRYPPTATEPWPPHIDLPYYNPLWPEANPYLERGTIELWGNVYQRQKGFMHRSHNDSEYPSNAGIWNPDLDMCGGPTNPVAYPDPVLGDDLVLLSQNFPGAAGSGVGYKLNIKLDNRTHFYSAPDNFYNRFMQLGLLTSTGAVNFNEAVQSKSMDARGGHYAFAANDVLLYDDGVNPGIDLSALTRDQGLIVNVQLSPENHPVLHQYRKLDTGEGFTVITEINPADPPQIVSSFIYPSYPQRMPEAFCIMPNGRRILARYQGGMQVLNEILPDGTLLELDAWLLAADVSLVNSRLHLKPASNSSLDIFLWLNTSELEIDGWGDITHLRKQLPVSTEDPLTPPITTAQLTAYPNPARHALSIDMKLPAHQEHQIEIFNIKGQKVRGFKAPGSKSAGDFSYEWDLKDEKQKAVSRGVYILRLKVDGKESISRRITVQ